MTDASGVPGIDLTDPEMLRDPLRLRTRPRPWEDVEMFGVLIPEGEPVTASIVSANRDPRAFADPTGSTSAASLDHRDISGTLTDHTSVSGPRRLGRRPRSHSPHCCDASPICRSPTRRPRDASLTRAPGVWRRCP